MSEPLSLIADPDIDKTTLLQAIRKLGPVTESERYWTDIANSKSYSKEHRRLAVFLLFKRFISPGITLYELARILDMPGWLTKEDITIVTVQGGKIPVTWSFEDTIFVLTVFPDVQDTNNRYANWAIYLKVAGKIKRDEFIEIIHGKPVSENVKNAELLQIGFSPDNLADIESVEQ